MKLLHAPASPFARTVRILLREGGGEGAVTEDRVRTAPGATDPAVAAANPTGRIPALLRDDGPALHDSRVIARFLDDHLGAGLYPAAPRLWEVLVLESTAHAAMDSAVSLSYENRRPEARRSPDWIAAQSAKIASALDAVEGRWMSHLAGPLDMAQVAVACALSYVDLRHGHLAWRDGRPGLAAWHERIEARPAFAATRPE